MATISISVTQNFLNPSVIQSVFAKHVKIAEQLPIIDIGAGTGNITQWIATQTKNQVVAYEIDEKLIPGLQQKMALYPRVVVKRANFLLDTQFRQPYAVVANIPFMNTTAIIKQLTSDTNFKEGYLIVQKEAAERFCGHSVKKPAGIQSTLLSIHFNCQILHTFSKKDFSPEPHVETVLLHLVRLAIPKTTHEEEFATFVTYLFNKSLPNIRRAHLIGRKLARAIDLGRIPLLQKKPSELGIDDFLYLFSLCDEETLFKMRETSENVVEQGRAVQKIFRTRNAENWRNMG